MNIRNLYIGASLIAAGMLTACSSSYLDVTPSTSINEEMLNNESVAQTAMSGLYEAMNTPYSGTDLNQNIGEAYIGLVFNDSMGIDYISAIWSNQASMPGLAGWGRMNQDSEFTVGFPWMYYYGLVGQANRIIDALGGTDNPAADEELSATLKRIKAEALTMRSHAYTKLMSMYGQRWEQSDEGNAYCFPLRIVSGNEPSPLATMNAVFERIYADLQTALGLYEASGQDRTNKWEANASVANGIWARAALLKHDWRTAADKAAAARKDFKLMEEKDLFAGFMSDNDDLIWGCNPSDVGLGYWSWGCHYAANGHYVNYWGYGAGAISLDLYNQMDKNDLRRKFFWTPDKLASLKPAAVKNPAGLKEDAFWNPTFVSATSFLNTSNGPLAKKNDKNTGMIDALISWLTDYHNDVFTGDRSLIVPEDGFYNYYFLTETVKDAKKSVAFKAADGKRYFGTPCNVPFGAQCKFWGYTPFGNSMLPWMRASEMALTEAEALAELGDANAAAVFTEFQKLRVPGYTCTSTGDALLNEIRVSRRVELFGEGQNFTDIKRWNMRHEHREWKANDKTSGNWIPGENLSEEQMSVNYSNGWRFAIPTREWQYNTAIDLSLLKVIN